MRIKCLIFFAFQFCFILNAQIRNGIVAKYTFNNGSYENDAGGEDPKAIGTSLVEDRFGNPKAACYLHGNYSSYLNLGTNKILKSDKATISIWVKIDNIMEKGEGVEINPIILTKSHGGDDFYEGYFIGYDYNLQKINASTGKDQTHQVSIYASNTFPIRKWAHVVLVYDHNFFEMFINGIREIRVTKHFKNGFLPTDSVMIGNTANSKNKRFLNGTVDDIQFFDRVLTDEEIQSLYNEQDPGLRNTIIKWSVIIIIFLIFTIILIVWFVKRIYKRKLEQEKTVNKVLTHMLQLETKAIRSQMNPHFIFNSLTALQRFILENDTPKAHLYLTKFSKLIRELLETNNSDSISLKEELSTLNMYLELEKLRFGNAFEYELTSEIDKPEKIKIPFMMIQPFIENAIWHGLMPRENSGLLKISFFDHGNEMIQCIVDDNGVGREYSAQQKDPSNKKSMAMDFINQRMELLNKSMGTKCYFEVIDKKNGSESLGTTIKILIPKLN